MTCECGRPLGKLKYTIRELAREGKVSVITRKRVCKVCHYFWMAKDEE